MAERDIKTMPTENDFQCFIDEMDSSYHQSIANIPLFDTKQTQLWTPDQKHKFAAVFYHLRGYFIDFMWYLANFTKDDRIKNVVFDNIQEELGLGGKHSHEQLYARFAEACGVNIHQEIIHKTHYLPFAREFNQNHLCWLSEHDYLSQFAAFAAYERLDNIDYRNLLEFAYSLDLPRQAHAFFRVHVYVEHFESTLDLLMETWQKNPEKVREAFQFIYAHQTNMWQTLSNTIFAESAIAPQ